MWEMDADGSNPVELRPPIPGRNIAPNDYSPDGSKLLIEHMRVGDGDIWLLDLNTGAETQLTSDYGMEDYPRWSPTGDKIYFLKGDYYGPPRNIWVMDADGSNKQKLTFGFVSEISPDVRRDGEKIVFTRYEPSTGYQNIYVMDVDGNNIEQITFDDALNVFVCWSPDGSHIAYTSTKDGAA